jgi:hypothetical protein
MLRREIRHQTGFIFAPISPITIAPSRIVV